ncbi:NlpC/P60 family protein [Lachnospiraceae bacterium XBB1006]|nr:NlpC/P60 family protein [Lachnospiraceae bacterium XBB1006]
MNIKRVDDKPLVIHTKQKAKIHRKVGRSATLKGCNVYTLRRTPKIRGATVGKTMYRSAAERMKANDGRRYRKSTIHEVDARETGLRQFKRNIREAKMPIRIKNTNLHIAGVAAKTVTEQVEGGKETTQAAALGYELAKPAVGTASKGAALFKRKALAKKQRKIKMVQPGGKLNHRAAKIKVTEALAEDTKVRMKKASIWRNGEKKQNKATTKARVSANQDYKMAQKNRMIQFFMDKMKAEHEQTDSVGKLVKDLVVRKIWTWVASIAPAIGAAFLVLLVTMFIVVIPAVLVTTVLYNSPLAIFMPSLEEGDTIKSVAEEYEGDFREEVKRIAREHAGCDSGELVYVDYEGTDAEPSNLCDIIAVYMVKHGVGETATILNEKTKGWMKQVVEDMCTYEIVVKHKHGKSILVVKVKLKSYRDMIDAYHFDEDEVKLLGDLMSPEGLEMMGYSVSTGGGGEPGVCSLTEEEIEKILADIKDSTRRTVLSYALHRVGYPYSQDVNLRCSGNYYDCSSLAYFSWKEAGVNISHHGAMTAAEEARGLSEAGKTVSWSQMKPGDLIFYSFQKNGRYKNISHVVIYAGHGMIVEAKGTKYGVVYGKAYKGSGYVMSARPGGN